MIYRPKLLGKFCICFFHNKVMHSNHFRAIYIKRYAHAELTAWKYISDIQEHTFIQDAMVNHI